MRVCVKLNYGSHIQIIFFCLKTIQRLSFFTRKRKNVDTTPTVKVARLIHKSWLVFYYHHPQPKKCSLDRVCKRAHNLCFFSVSIPRISNLEKSNATFTKKKESDILNIISFQFIVSFNSRPCEKISRTFLPLHFLKLDHTTLNHI